jgi:hypothetical protein
VESVQFRINAPFYYSRPQPSDSAGRMALYHLVDGRTKATRLLTYLYRLAAAKPGQGGKPGAQAGADSEHGSTSQAGREVDDLRRPILMMIDGWIVPPGLRQAKGDPMALPQFDFIWPAGKRPAMPMLFEMDFEQNEVLERVRLLMLRESDEAPGASLFGALPRFGHMI